MEKAREMILTLKNDEKKVEITCSADSDIFEVMDEVRGLLIAWGYHPQSVVDGCQYILETYEEKEEK